jgi:hypothetical protein
MCLLRIDGYINGIEYDFGRFATDENQALLGGLLASFDPFTNQEIFDVANKTYDLNSTDSLKKLFETPVKCLLRIQKSIELWTGEFGTNGYFDFIEEQIGHLVENDDKMDYTIMLEGKESFEKLGIDITSLDRLLLEGTEE